MRENNIDTMQLGRRTAQGGFWVFSLRIIQLALQITKLIILARVLNPSDFGLMGIALLTIAALETFSQTGFQSALIQKKEDTKPYLDSAWTVLILRGVALFVILYLIAPYVALFFKVQQATLIIRVIGISFLLKALTNIGVVYFQKELEFNKQFVYQLSTLLADFIVAIPLALIFRNVWALVCGLLAGNFIGLIVSYLLHPHRPKISLDLIKAKELFAFGKWVLGSSILVFLLTQGDDAFVGKFLGVTMLGFYQLAYRISNMPATEITRVISQVTFPAYSKLQDNTPKLREAYLKVLQVTAFLSFPIAGLIFLLAPDFTKIFLGEKWMPMVAAMQVLVMWGLIRSIGATTGPIFYAVGRPKIGTKLQFIQLILLVITIYPLSEQWGILGTSLSVVFAALIPNILASYETIKITGCKISSFSKLLWIPFINSAIGLICIILLKENVFVEKNISIFVVYIMTFALNYLALTYVSNKFLNYNISNALDMFKKSWKNA